jgi:predicted lipoprotein with Yx(FWY)xxD motif
MTNISKALAGLLAAAALAPCGMAFAAEPAMIEQGRLVDHKARTLYTYDKDSVGKSVCNDQCASNWPPLSAAADSSAEGRWTVITRDDKTRQWAYDGKPLYTFKSDTRKGDAEGDGKGGVWHIVKP